MGTAAYTLVPSLDLSAQAIVWAQAASSSSPGTMRPASDSAGFSHGANAQCTVSCENSSPVGFEGVRPFLWDMESRCQLLG